MRTRHKIPTIFNLSMVDVLCCALGCVILLWLVNFREAKQRTLAAGQTAIKLDEAEKQLRDLQAERDAALAQVDKLGRERTQLRAQLTDVEDRLAKNMQEGRMLARDLSTAD